MAEAIPPTPALAVMMADVAEDKKKQAAE